MRLFSFLIFCTSALVACTSVQKQNAELVQDRALKLRPLSNWYSLTCDVEVELTEPTMSRYKQLFKDDKQAFKSGVWLYKWSARESTCDVRAVEPSPAKQAQRAFVESAMCLLLHVHWVNSPFDELTVLPNDIVTAGEDQVQIRSNPQDPQLGVYLSKQNFRVETRTKARGVFAASYEDLDGEWLPTQLEQDSKGTRFAIEGMVYSSERVGGRRLLESFWMAMGNDQLMRQAQVRLKNCQRD